MSPLEGEPHIPITLWVLDISIVSFLSQVFWGLLSVQIPGVGVPHVGYQPFALLDWWGSSLLCLTALGVGFLMRGSLPVLPISIFSFVVEKKLTWFLDLFQKEMIHMLL